MRVGLCGCGWGLQSAVQCLCANCSVGELERRLRWYQDRRGFGLAKRLLECDQVSGMLYLLLFNHFSLLHLSLVEGLKVLQEVEMKLFCWGEGCLPCKEVSL